MSWTDEQWRAITERGSHLLVAAAAGSGKTAVLVERIIRTVADEEQPIDIDRLLVATFTNAAAAEMRHRLRDALEKALSSQPSSRHLRRQLALIGRASITTLHSFCLEAVRRYAHLTDLDPALRIANETEAALLRQEALEDVFEEAYGESREGDPFWQLSEQFGGERGDEELFQLTERLYDFSRSNPFPEPWLEDAAEAFAVNGASGLPPGHPWLESLEMDMKLELQGMIATLSRALALSLQPGGPQAYADNLRTDIEGVERLRQSLEGGGWLALQQTVAEGRDAGAFGRLKAQKGDEVDAQVKERAQSLRKDAAERLKSLKEQLLSRTLDEYAAELLSLAPAMKELVRLTKRFGKAYRERKLAKGLVDFTDLEHACLHILRDPASTPDHLIPTEAALAYREQFLEVYVDEYQDTNAVQETILRLVSRGDTPGDTSPGNRFMVGDVKQSIYRFRLAEPGLFLNKYKTYGKERNVGQSGGVRIDLARNFRSRREVVDAVNFLFRQTMHEAAAELDYDERAELVCGAAYPDGDPFHDLSAEVALIDRAGETEEAGDASCVEENSEGVPAGEEADTAEWSAAELEARAIGQSISRLMGRAGVPPMQVYDKTVGGTRNIAYRDIVILLRADKAWAPALIDGLKRYGIPAYAELGGGYFQATEVEAVLSLLQTIDNPLQDIPLAAALRSPMFGFTAEELGRIRIIGGKNGPLFDAVGSAAVHQAQDDASAALRDKAARFLATLEPWRTAARQGTLADLILRIYRETGYPDFVGGLQGGAQRQANLRSLYDRARQYEATSFRGLFRFLRFIERLRDSGADLGAARTLGENEDVVRIMSIHKSKGLEFPVVFVAGLGKAFNRSDERDLFLVHKQLGFGPRFVNTELAAAYPTLPQLAIRRRLRAESLAEEMRVLYVALTRAKEKLILIGSVKGLPRKLEAWSAAAADQGPKLPAYAAARASSYLDWIMPALLRHPASAKLREEAGISVEGAEIHDGSSFRLVTVLPDSLSEAAAARGGADPWVDNALRQLLPVPDDWTAQDNEVARKLGWRYERPTAAALFSKTSVTEWKRRLQDDSDADGWNAGFPSSALPARRPRFLERSGLTPVERGVAYHAAMQHLPLRRGLTVEEVSEYLSGLVLRELLTPEQRESVDAQAVCGFLATEAGERMLQAKRVLRELPFSVGLPASLVYGEEAIGMKLDEETAREPVLVQGVIDCLFEEDGGMVLIDYKTDRVTGIDSLQELKERYRVQLQVYAEAVRLSLGKSILSKYLYFFDGGHLIKV